MRELNVHTYTPVSLGFMQIVPGSYKPYPCSCHPDTGGNHSYWCSQAVSPVSPIWADSPPPQVQGELCGRCWQNHIPGTVCMCSCHTTRQITTSPPFDNGDDLDVTHNT